MAKRVFRGMVILTVLIGLLLVVFVSCLVTVFVVIPIVWLLLTLSVATHKIKSIIKKGKEWLRI
jgi:hypothetical protein